MRLAASPLVQVKLRCYPPSMRRRRQLHGLCVDQWHSDITFSAATGSRRVFAERRSPPVSRCAARPHGRPSFRHVANPAPDRSGPADLSRGGDGRGAGRRSLEKNHSRLEAPRPPACSASPSPRTRGFSPNTALTSTWSISSARLTSCSKLWQRERPTPPQAWRCAG